MTKSRVLHFIELSRVSYSRGLLIQSACEQRHFVDTSRVKDILLLLEHDPVYTVGIRSQNYDPKLADYFRSLGADFHQTDRGGLITFHGPGQLVAYPIINLKNFNLTMKLYVRNLENAIIKTCSTYGIKSETTENPGVWVGENKIGAIGVHGNKFITTHGLALNCNTDLKWFHHIVPCGLVGKGVTSISKELDKPITVEDATKRLVAAFSEVFDCETVKLDSLEDPEDMIKTSV